MSRRPAMKLQPRSIAATRLTAAPVPMTGAASHLFVRLPAARERTPSKFSIECFSLYMVYYLVQ
jgi:hypothetical protein